MSEVPTPWLCLQHDLRQAGIDPASITRVTDQTMARNMEALKAGKVDVIQVFEPFPSLLLADKAAHVWYEAAHRGPTSYTTFYARRGTLDEAARRAAAHGAGDRQDGDSGSPRHPAPTSPRRSRATSPTCRGRSSRPPARATRRSASGTTTPILPRVSYDRLRDSLVSGGFVSPGTPFETAVDNSLAEEVLRA